MAKRRRKKTSTPDPATQFVELMQTYFAATANINRISSLGNLSRPGGLTQFNVAAQAQANAIQQVLLFINDHQEYLPLYRNALRAGHI